MPSVSECFVLLLRRKDRPSGSSLTNSLLCSARVQIMQHLHALLNNIHARGVKHTQLPLEN